MSYFRQSTAEVMPWRPTLAPAGIRAEAWSIGSTPGDAHREVVDHEHARFVTEGAGRGNPSDRSSEGG
jgi:hypothetical protein